LSAWERGGVGGAVVAMKDSWNSWGGTANRSGCGFGIKCSQADYSAVL
jgi:hypothetical protein